ncbi:MAG: hypothetical protein WD578_02495, partial [Bacteroidales bacterium]
MNKHIFLDNLTARVGALAAGKKKFFSTSIKSEPFEKLVDSIEVKVPAIRGEETFELEAVTAGGPIGIAFRVEKWMGTDYPTLIYHHGNNERPFDYGKYAKNTFMQIFVKEKEAFDLNLVVVRAPFHDISLKEYQEKITDLENFMTMIAASVRLNEELIRTLPSNQKVYTCGISLGGWVTNLHRSIYNSSFAYIPMLAGSYLGELFLQSAYRRLAGSLALENEERIRELLNFDAAFSAVETKNVYPLLARYDRFIEYHVQ